MNAPLVITLSVMNRTVRLRAYVEAVKLAKANPDTTFQHGLDTWWPTTGAQIRPQYRRAVHERINQAIPWSVRAGGRGKPQMEAAIADAMADIRTNPDWAERDEDGERRAWRVFRPNDDTGEPIDPPDYWQRLTLPRAEFDT